MTMTKNMTKTKTWYNSKGPHSDSDNIFKCLLVNKNSFHFLVRLNWTSQDGFQIIKQAHLGQRWIYAVKAVTGLWWIGAVWSLAPNLIFTALGRQGRKKKWNLLIVNQKFLIRKWKLMIRFSIRKWNWMTGLGAFWSLAPKEIFTALGRQGRKRSEIYQFLIRNS